MMLLLSGIAFGEPQYRFAQDHFYTRVAEIEVACNVPVNFEVRADDGVIDTPRPYRAYPPVDLGDCSVLHLRWALQTALDSAPCTYQVDTGHGGLVVAPTHLTPTGCKVAPSRLDEPLPVGLDSDAFAKVMRERGLDVGFMREGTIYESANTPLTMRALLLRQMRPNPLDPRRPVYRAYHTEILLGGIVTYAGYPSKARPPTGPYDYRTMWWVGENGPRYRPPTLEESTAYFENSLANDEGRLSDEEWANYRATEMRSRLLNPRADGRDWPDLDLILKKGSYDVNGCLPDSTCALRQSGGSLP